MERIINSQLIRYIMTGGVTTLINYVLYFLLNNLGCNYVLANCIAWMGAVLFAFYANRRMVFHSKGEKTTEFISFISLRVATLLVENALLVFFVEFAEMEEMMAKIAVSVVTVLLNYFACKYSIFKERGVSHE